MYLRKEINSSDELLSNQTYNFGSAPGSLFSSYGLSTVVELPRYNTTLNAELFSYAFIYNDFFLDYNRLGAIFSVKYGFFSNLFLTASAGYYQDAYEVERIKSGSCANVDLSNNSERILLCDRLDSGYMFTGNLEFYYTQFSKLTGQIQLVQNNSSLKEYETNKYNLLVTYSIAFPSIGRASRYVNRYADIAFTKETE